MITAQLSSRLAHHDSRHQRHARHVTANPELVVGHVLVAHADAGLDVVVDNRRQLLHFMALRIDAADLVDIGNDMIEVVRRKIDNQIFAGHGPLDARSSPDADGSCAAGCTPDGDHDLPS